MVKFQHGDVKYLEDNSNFPKANVEYHIKAKNEGFVENLDAQKFGQASMILGAGRKTKDSKIDYSAGILLHKKVGKFVKKGDTIATLYSSCKEKCLDAEKVLKEAIVISSNEPKPLIYSRVSYFE